MANYELHAAESLFPWIRLLFSLVQDRWSCPSYINQREVSPWCNLCFTGIFYSEKTSSQCKTITCICLLTKNHIHVRTVNVYTTISILLSVTTSSNVIVDGTVISCQMAVLGASMCCNTVVIVLQHFVCRHQLLNA